MPQSIIINIKLTQQVSLFLFPSRKEIHQFNFHFLEYSYNIGGPIYIYIYFPYIPIGYGAQNSFQLNQYRTENINIISRGELNAYLYFPVYLFIQPSFGNQRMLHTFQNLIGVPFLTQRNKRNMDSQHIRAKGQYNIPCENTSADVTRANQ